MPLPAGTRLGPFEILTPLGAGGMGEVYRANDTRLGRQVAIKVLPDLFARDRDRLARFEREAKVLAALNHPNIAQVYGLEDHALVMELVDGPTLEELIGEARGESRGLPLDQVLPIARQIADALECAHEAGIIHRDLKPANVKVRDDFTVKVLDFGLAKALTPDAAHASADLVNSPTLTNRATALGVVLGTAAYMAPEQAKGKPVDRRADVWAFGVVVYEMLTGRRLFAGEDVSDTLAAVLTREPNWNELPAATPPALRRLLTRCLARDRRARLDSMASARLEIDEALGTLAGGRAAAAGSVGESAIAYAGGASGEAAQRRVAISGLRSVALLTMGVAVAAAAAGWILGRATAGPASSSATNADPVFASVLPPDNALSAFHRGFALSPDGRTLVASARSADGIRALWKRRLSDPGFDRLPGTDGALYPFWSPDGAEIAFFADGALKRIPANGGPAQTIAQAIGGFPHGSWNEHGEILLSVGSGASAGIFRVAATGGVPEKLPIDGNVLHPEWLPGGRAFLFMRAIEDRIELHAASLAGSRPPQRVLDLEVRDPGARVSPAGVIFYNRAGVLTAQRIDPDSWALVGPAVALARAAGTPRAWFAATPSHDALILLSGNTATTGGNPGDPISRLRWVNRQGQIVGDLGEPARYWTLRLSPDGKRAVVNPDKDLWIIDTATSIRTRLTAGPNTFPGAIWSPDSKRVMYRERGALWVRRVDEQSAATKAADTGALPVDWSPDGASVLLAGRDGGANGSLDILLLRLADPSPRRFVASEFNEHAPRFSPNGRWIAYVSNLTGRDEIYLKAIDGDAAAIRITADGGEHPRWRQDGRELFYITPTDEFVAVDLTRFETEGIVGGQQKLFRIVVNDLIRDTHPPFDVTADGQRFLLNIPELSEPLTLIQGMHRLLSDRR